MYESLIIANTFGLVIIFVFIWAIGTYSGIQLDMISHELTPLLGLANLIKSFFGYNDPPKK